MSDAISPSAVTVPASAHGWRERLRRHLGATPRRRRIAATVGITTFGVLVSAVLVAAAGTDPPSTPVEKAWAVSVARFTPAPLSPQLAAYGRVESANLARLRTSIDATVERTLVREGDIVARGQLLIELDARQFVLALGERNADLARAEAAYASLHNEQLAAARNLGQYRELARIAEAKLARYESLHAKGMVPVTLLDEVRDAASQRRIQLAEHETAVANQPHRLREMAAGVERARALRDLARSDLEQTRVRAPFAGPVTALHVAPGARSTVPVLIEIADASALEVRVAIAERHLPALQTAFARHALEAEARIADSDVVLPLQLARIARAFRAGHGSVDAFFTIGTSALPSAGGLPLGSVVDVRVGLPAQSDVIALPLTALYDDTRIYVVERERLRAVPITRVGERVTSDGTPEVLVRAPRLPLPADVVVTQLPRAIDGLKVAAVRANG